jgi:hypothetical protein
MAQGAFESNSGITVATMRTARIPFSYAGSGNFLARQEVFTAMMANWAPAHTACGPNSGRILDTARGILIGLRRCHSESAMDELHSAALRHKVPVFAMAWALVHLAGNGAKTPSFVDAQSAARHEWGPLFAGSAVVTC